MTSDPRARRLLELKDAVKAFFEVTGALGGGWTEAFRAVRRNEDMAESFVGDLRELLSYIEQEFGARAGSSPGLVEDRLEPQTTVRKAAQAMVSSMAPGDDLFADPTERRPQVRSSRPPSPPPPSPPPARDTRRDGSPRDARVPSPPAIAYGPTGPSPRAEPAPPRVGAGRTAAYVAAGRTPPTPQAASSPPPSTARSSSSAAPAKGAASSSPQPSDPRSLAPRASAPSPGRPLPEVPRPTRAMVSRALTDSGERTHRVERLPPERPDKTDKTTLHRPAPRAPSASPSPPSPAPSRSPSPRRFAPNDDFDGATRVDARFQREIDESDQTGRQELPSGKRKR